MFVVFLAMFVIGVWGDETSLIPEMKLGSTTLNVRGFVTGFYIEKAKKETIWKDFWLLSKWQLNEGLSLDGEFNLAYDDQEGIEDNWLRVLRLSYRLSDNWKLNLGRLPLSTIYITPPPYLIETVNYPKKPVNIYGWAVQLAGKFGDWSIKTDISGRSGVAFDQRENLDQAEWSGRLTRNFGTRFMLGVTSQLSERNQMVSLDYWWKPVDKLAIRGAWFRAIGEDLDWVGAYSFAAYRLKPWLEFHTQIEGRTVGHNREVISTNGIRLIGGKGQGCLTIDYESVLDGEQDNRLLARVRVRF